MKFESRKDTLYTISILGTILILIGLTLVGIIKDELEKDEYWVLFVIIVVVVLLLWMFFGTNYKLSKENGLVYYCGPVKGKIRLDRITEIEKDKTLWVGLKPATARKGLIVKYDKYNEIYISPKTNTSFIEKILELKSDIKIK